MRRFLRYLCISLAAVFAALAPGAAADEIVVSSDISPKSGGRDEQFIFSVSIYGESMFGKTTLPELEGGDGFAARYVGPQTKVQITNGSFESRIVHVWRLTPEREGELRTPRARVVIAGKEFVTPSIDVKVSKAAQPAEGTVDARDALLQQEVEPQNAFMGEQVVYTVRLLSAINLAQVRLQEAAVENVWQEILGEEEQGHTMRGNRPYQTLLWRRALYPLRPGKITIPARILTAEKPSYLLDPFDLLDPFGSGAKPSPGGKVTLKAEAAEISVKPLPPAPSDLPRWGVNSTVVGETTVEISGSQDPMKVGKSRTFTVQVTSLGNISALKGVQLPAGNFRFYQESPGNKSFENNGQLISRRVFPFTIVPTAPGTLEIPPIELGFFDPRRESYRRAITQSLSIEVSGMIAADSAGTRQNAALPDDASDNLLPSPPPNSPSPTATPENRWVYKRRSIGERLAQQITVQGIIFVVFTSVLPIIAVAALRRVRRRHAPYRSAKHTIASADTAEKLYGALQALKGLAAPHDGSLTLRAALEPVLAGEGALLAATLALGDTLERARYAAEPLAGETVREGRETLLAVLNAVWALRTRRKN